ncbi:uncharacterized protein LOC127135242 [Lathyrus oleraceus]|uniref:uncharacterized protein LOC127135242 n=1 Tax=Pisum sativum TaxID=3888 RepID=UPI0021CF9004|nr:uncharacterized protein LOC127135242 [Pisum sativum]
MIYQGDQIHVVTRNRYFKDWIEQLKEHETYAIYNGEPMANDGPLKVCSHSLKLVFNGGTTISNIIIPKIPPHQFKYKAIGDFLNGHFQNDMLYDVIGILQDVVKTQLGDGGTKSYANIMLHDDVAKYVIHRFNQPTKVGLGRMRSRLLFISMNWERIVLPQQLGL